MLHKVRRLLKQEDGLGTVELVIILAVLVGIALIFRSYIFDFVDSIMTNIFGNELESIKTNPIPSSK
jgi:Flp pilus assembly pilin Flp